MTADPERLDLTAPERLDLMAPERLDHFMARANTIYYATHDPFADFTTSPEVSQVFGEIIGLWSAVTWQMLGRPTVVSLVEAGPGRGTLMADILRATSRVKGFHESISVHLMEVSPALRQKQWNSLAGKHTDINWHLGFGEIPNKPLLLVANEFFDALPIRQFLHLDSGWKERMVALDPRGKLHFVLEPATPPYPLKDEPISDSYYEYSDAATQMALVIGNRIVTYGGTALIIDYGYEGSHGDTLQAVKNHAYHDILTDPGTADITAHVDFNNVIHAAVTGGANAYGPVDQGKFLLSLGATERTEILCKKATAKQKKSLLAGLERLTDPKQMGELFKLLALVHADLPKPEGF